MPSPSPTEAELAPEPPPDRTGLAMALGALVTVAGFGTAGALYVTGRRRSAL